MIRISCVDRESSLTSNSVVKVCGSTGKFEVYLGVLIAEDVGAICGGALRCVVIRTKVDCEDRLRDCNCL